MRRATPRGPPPRPHARQTPQLRDCRGRRATSKRLGRATRPNGRGKRSTRPRIGRRSSCPLPSCSRRPLPDSFRICGAACRRRPASRVEARCSRRANIGRRAISSRRRPRSIPTHDQARALLGVVRIFPRRLSRRRRSRSRRRFGVNRRGKASTTAWDGVGFVSAATRLAAAAFRSAVDRNPDYVDALERSRLGTVRAGQLRGRPSIARKGARTGRGGLLSAEPPDVTILRGKMAWSLYYLERHREALAMFIRASLAAPESYQYQVGMGWCYLKLGQRDDARAAFRRAMKLGPATRRRVKVFGVPTSDAMSDTQPSRLGPTPRAEHPHRCTAGHRWQHDGPTAVGLPRFPPTIRSPAISRSSARRIVQCAAGGPTCWSESSTPTTATCATGNGTTTGRCLDNLVACCPWCFPKADAEPIPGARRGAHISTSARNADRTGGTRSDAPPRCGWPFRSARAARVPSASARSEPA